MNWVLNAALYQVVWFVSVLGGNDHIWAGLLLLLSHFYFSPCRRADGILVALLLGIGLLLDGTLRGIGFFRFNADGFPIPLWLMLIWMALATLPNHSLSWIKHRPVLAALFGMTGGPLAYWAGERLGAAAFQWPLVESLLLLALIWGLLMPAIMLMSLYLLPIKRRAA